MMVDDTLPKPCNEIAPLISGSEDHPLPSFSKNDGTRDELCSSLSTSQDFHDIASTTTKMMECTRLSSFPFRLHDMLNDSTNKGFEDVVCWREDGRSFLIRDKDRFATKILPEFFQGQTHYKSFQRQLNIYGFTRVVGGTRQEMGTYTHQLLVRGEPNLCRFMIRTKIKNKGARSRKSLLAKLSHPQQSWNLPEKDSTAMLLANNKPVAKMAAFVVGTNSLYAAFLPGNDGSSWQNTPLAMPLMKSSGDDQEDLLIESTKRLQALEEKNTKILKLIEMRLAMLERNTRATTANIGRGIPSLHHMDSLATGSPKETGGGLWNLDHVNVFMGGHTENIVPQDNETLEEEMEHLDNIFNICESHCSNANFLIPLELFSSSADMTEGNTVSATDGASFEAQHAEYPDVAAELVRIFG